MKGYIYAIYYDRNGYRFAYVGSTMRSPMARFEEHCIQWRKGRRGGTSSWKIYRCAKQKQDIRFGVMEVLNNTTELALRRVEQIYIDTYQCCNYYIDYNKRERKRPRLGLPPVTCTYSFPLKSVEQALQWRLDREILASLSDSSSPPDDTYKSTTCDTSSTGDGTLNSFSAA
jgi:hypothetical protein